MDTVFSDSAEKEKRAQIKISMAAVAAVALRYNDKSLMALFGLLELYSQDKK